MRGGGRSRILSSGVINGLGFGAGSEALNSKA